VISHNHVPELSQIQTENLKESCSRLEFIVTVCFDYDAIDQTIVICLWWSFEHVYSIIKHVIVRGFRRSLHVTVLLKAVGSIPCEELLYHYCVDVV
jgi:hypothetical protein